MYSLIPTSIDLGTREIELNNIDKIFTFFELMFNSKRQQISEMRKCVKYVSQNREKNDIALVTLKFHFLFNYF